MLAHTITDKELTTYYIKKLKAHFLNEKIFGCLNLNQLNSIVNVLGQA